MLYCVILYKSYCQNLLLLRLSLWCSPPLLSVDMCILSYLGLCVNIMICFTLSLYSLLTEFRQWKCERDEMEGNPTWATFSHIFLDRFQQIQLFIFKRFHPNFEDKTQPDVLCVVIILNEMQIIMSRNVAFMFYIDSCDDKLKVAQADETLLQSVMCF